MITVGIVKGTYFGSCGLCSSSRLAYICILSKRLFFNLSTHLPPAIIVIGIMYFISLSDNLSMVIYVISLPDNLSMVIYVMSLPDNLSVVIYVISIPDNLSMVIYVISLPDNLSMVIYVMSFPDNLCLIVYWRYVLIPSGYPTLHDNTHYPAVLGV